MRPQEGYNHCRPLPCWSADLLPERSDAVPVGRSKTDYLSSTLQCLQASRLIIPAESAQEVGDRRMGKTWDIQQEVVHGTVLWSHLTTLKHPPQ